MEQIKEILLNKNQLSDQDGIALNLMLEELNYNSEFATDNETYEIQIILESIRSRILSSINATIAN